MEWEFVYTNVQLDNDQIPYELYELYGLYELYELYGLCEFELASGDLNRLEYESAWL